MDKLEYLVDILKAVAVILFAFSLYGIACLIGPDEHSVSILKETKDERGLTSVIFKKDGQYWALDYLTKQQLDSLKNIR